MGGPTKKRAQKAAILVVVLGFVLQAVLAAPASAAGTLVGSTFSVSNAAYAVPGVSNARYDFGFTPQTSASSVGLFATVPADTEATSPRYFATSGDPGNYAWAPDSAANSLTNTVDLKVQATLANWATACQYLVGKRDISQESYYLRTGCTGSEGFAELVWTTDGSTQRKALSTVAIPYAANQTGWLRVTLTSSTGAAVFYTSTDGANWTQLGANLTTATGTIYNGTDNVFVDGYSYATGINTGRFWFGSVASSISGTSSSPSQCNSAGVVACFNPLNYAAGLSWTSASPQGETWTMERGVGTTQPADMVSDLTVTALSNLPAGSKATLRRYGGTTGRNITLVFPSPYALNTGTLRSFSVGDLKNTMTPGSYSSTIRTADTSSPPGTIDSGSTTSVVFGYPTVSPTASVIVDAALAFVVATTPSCDGLAATAGVITSATAVDFGHIAPGTPALGAQTLQVTTNAGGGFVVTARSPSALTSSNGIIAAAPGTNATPASFPAAVTAAFGYHVNNISRFTGGNWAGLETTSQPVVENATNACIAYQVQAASSTPAGSYAGTVIYTAVPTF